MLIASIWLAGALFELKKKNKKQVSRKNKIF
jgi:hypothetical protein